MIAAMHPFGKVVAMVSIFLSFLLAECKKQSGEPEPGGSVIEVAAFLVPRQSDMPDMHALPKDDESFSTYVAEDYGIGKERLEEVVICYMDGIEASEVSILAFHDPSQA